jgi:hypothetical protein
MTAFTSIGRRLVVGAATVTSAAYGLGAILQLTDEQSGQTSVVGVEHVTLAAFTVSLVALVPIVLYLARIAGRAWPARVGCTGLVALSALTLISNLRGEDPSFFPAVAIVSNALIVVGLIGLAVALTRNGLFPKALAVALPVTWIFALPLSAVGGGLVAGAYWLVVGWLLHQGELPRPLAPRLEPA